MPTIAWVVVVIVACAVSGAALYFVGYNNRKKTAEAKIGSAETEAKRIVNDAIKTAEQKRKEAIIEAKDEAFKLKAEADKEIKDRRAEVARQENRIDQKETALDKKTEALEKKEEDLKQRSELAEARLAEVEQLKIREAEKLETLAGLSQEDAKEVLLHRVDEELTHEKAVRISAYEANMKEECDTIARNMIGQAISRCAADHSSETTVSVVPLPSDEMKGRIIGREGRNIRAFEQLTGIDLIVDDTPEAVVLSGFDPVRRETARVALESLLTDGRIHPGRIEETVEKAKENVEERIREAAEKACFETGVSGLHPEIMRLIGRLHFRTSYGQNVLNHSIEVSHLAGAMAGELGGRVGIARRAGLLHDLGKAVDFERDGSHAQIGADIASNRGEHGVVVESILAHHEEVEIKSLEAALVQAADAISASRPGARRETLEKYLKRLEELENIAHSFEGVDKVYAIQAGREVRVIVKPDKIDDLSAHKMAKGMVDRIESEMDYPGQIRVTVIRETRAVEYAK